jgi:2-C-methyl-D-erythritol 4-phosphate cytidylyltransferase
VVAAPAAHVARARRTLGALSGRTPVTVVAGGSTRQESVARGLLAAPAAEIVVVHDAVRPFITEALIDRVVAAARRDGAAICALPIKETLKRVRDGLVEATVDRAELWSVQTPQAFRGRLLREAHDKAHRDGVTGTDDAMLVERLGIPVRVVEGLEANVKITTRGDLARARAGVPR